MSLPPPLCCCCCSCRRQVYETAADVCTRAQDYPEALKALQQLARLIYPALAAQEQQLAAAEAAAEAQRAPVPGAPPGLVLHGRPAAAGAGGASGGSSSSRPGAAAAAPAWDAGEEAEEEWAALAGGLATLDDASIAAALRRPPFRRWPEVAAALALYFACVQQGGQGECRLDTLATLRRLRRPLLGTAEVQGALALHAALAAGDYVSLFRRRAAAPRLVQLVTDAAAAAARERALAAMAAAYRNIAAAAVCRALDLDAGGRQLMLCLKLLADR